MKPGYHSTNINVGFYTTVHGLGATPSLTEVGGIHVDQYNNMSLDNFWRSAENFHVKGSTRWSVSQASPLRRAHIEGNLYLSQNGYSSGGYIGDVQVDGTILNGSQQQFMLRNTSMKSYNGGNWNVVFVGSPGAPRSHCGKSGGNPYSTIDSSPVIAEKPYIVMGSDGKYSLMKPKIEFNKRGNTPNW